MQSQTMQKCHGEICDSAVNFFVPIEAAVSKIMSHQERGGSLVSAFGSEKLEILGPVSDFLAKFWPGVRPGKKL